MEWDDRPCGYAVSVIAAAAAAAAANDSPVMLDPTHG